MLNGLKNAFSSGMRPLFSNVKSIMAKQVIRFAHGLCQPAILGAAALFFALQTVDAVAGAIYKSVDKDGNIVFTDQPLEGAESLNEAAQKTKEALEAEENVSSESSVSPTADEPDSETEGVLVAPEPKNPPKATYVEPKEPATFLPVTTIEILTPIHDAILQDPLGNTWVEFQSYPTPMHESGLTAQLWMDDILIASGKRPMLSLPPPERGTRVLQVKLVDEKGRLYLSSEKTQIHVKYRVAGQ